MLVRMLVWTSLGLGLWGCLQEGRPPDQAEVPGEDTLAVVTQDSTADPEALQAPVSVLPEYGPIRSPAAIGWQELDTGLDYAEVVAPIPCSIGPSTFDILRIDPKYYALDLINAGQLEDYSQTVAAYARQFGLLAAFNAGMYQRDGKTSTGFLQYTSYTNNPNLNAKYKTILAFNPKVSAVPPVRLIDLDCDDWAALKTQYHSFTQCIRMVSCTQQNVWSRQNRRWSMICVGLDAKGRLLFAFTRSPYSVYDFIHQLQLLPLGLQQAMYLEGGPEASFFLHAGGRTIEKMGSYETGFWENDSNDQFWAIPNIIGIRKR